ncbi:hypothetical protein [Providencia alcalifaciens]|uniref:hypothetical protein n=1 Tax=Providencia alcalifaciens TaxID=126385 RepID=UPI00029C6B9B|nr:hypothetical protein OO9_04805 [Providencia alcalifaciens Dmel2]
MNHEMLTKISKKFRRILPLITNQKILRSELIYIATEELQLTKKKASGLIDRAIHQLKKQGLVISDGCTKNISYIFSFEVINPSKFHIFNDNEFDLPSEKEILEKELSLIHYELQAYLELLEKLPQKKFKITKLQHNATKKFNQLHGKLRAINQLLSL